MAGFILGTGSGILAAAAVYYTLSVDLAQQTAALRGDLQNSSHVLSKSFDPQAPPPAASALVGPSYPQQPRFSETLRSRWNVAIGKAFDTVRTADLASAGGVLVESSGNLMKKLGSEASKVEERVEAKVVDFGQRVKETGEQLVNQVESAKEGAALPNSGLGVVGGDVRSESYTGGPAVYVRAKRESERHEGRLV